ncbi:hypothetical protein U1Q18_032333, partial [Sarracenia purpurea var. burkii]
YLFFDKPPPAELLPWPSTSPPFRISDDTSKLERESKHEAPIMVRMVHSILETVREEEGGGGGGRFCVDEFGVPLTVEKGIHQIDLHGDISGFLSAHPQSLLLSLHHFDFVNPIFPSMDRFQSTTHLMKAANADQSRLLQQTICYQNQRNWSISVSWGYSVHIYDRIYPRSMLKRPLETFMPWMEMKDPKQPAFMFNTRWPCETPTVFFFESVPKVSSADNLIVTTYSRSQPPSYPNCPWKGNHSADHISRVQVFSTATKRKDVERSECCDIEHLDGTNTAGVKLRACKDDEIIA